MKAILQILMMFLVIHQLHAQIPEIPVQAEVEEENFHIPYEKIYLHIDRSHYFANDTIWFKAYAKTEPKKNDSLDYSSENMYVYLSKATDTNILKKTLVRMENGSGTANIILSDLEAGDYFLSAYTDLMRIWSDDYIFQKAITIQEPGKLVAKKDQNDKVNISFHPESGLLIPEVNNKAVVLARNGSGFPASSFQGYFMNSRSDTLSTIQIDKKGMALMELVPNANDTYHILGRGADGNWEKYDLPNFFQEGVLIQTDFQSHPDKLFITLVKSPEIKDQKFQMVALASGKPVYELIFDMNEAQQSMVLDKENFMPGIFNIAVLDDSGNILGERNVYLHPGAQPVIGFTSQKQKFNPRENVRLALEVMDKFDEGLESELSVSVIDMNQVSQLENSNIGSHYSLLAHLSGEAQNFHPEFDPTETNFEKKLDMMLMAFPLRSSLSNSLALTSSREVINIPSGFKQKMQLLGEEKKPVSEPTLLEVLIYPSQGFPEVREIETDEKGFFTLEGLFFQDHAPVLIQEIEKNKRGKVEKYPIKPEYIRLVDSELPVAMNQKQIELKTETQSTYLNDIHLYRKIREADIGLREVLLDTVDVENRRERFGISDKTSIFGVNADITLEIPDRGYDHMNVFLYMRGRVPGMIMLGDPNDLGNPPMVFFRMGMQKQGFTNGLNPSGGGATILLNGVITASQFVAPILLSDVQKIEILNNVASTSVFGARASAGVINVITKQAYASFNPPKREEAIKVPGFSQPYRFSEIAEGPKVQDPFKNNLKSTVYWNPYVETDFEGKGEIEFTLSDASSDFLIIVEGLSKEGEPIFGTYQISTQ